MVIIKPVASLPAQVAIPYGYKFTSYAEAADHFMKKYPQATEQETHTPTMFLDVVDPDSYWRQIAQAETKSAKSDVLNSYLQDSLSLAAPSSLAMWLISEVNIHKAIDFFDGDPSADYLAAKIAEFKVAGCDCSWEKTKIPIEYYRKMCVDFRKHMNFNEALMGELTGSVTKEFKVEIGKIVNVKKVLTALKEKRGEQLSKSVDRGGAKHVNEYNDYCSDFFRTGIVIPQLMIRNKSKLFGRDENNEVVEQGALLVSTALSSSLSQGEIDDDEVNKFLGKLSGVDNKLAMCIYNELKAISEGNVQGSPEGGGPYQQAAGIDSVVSSAFWIFKLAGITTLHEFQVLNLLLNKIAISPKGRTKTDRILRSSGIRSVIALLTSASTSTDIYLPPFVFTVPRCEDIFSTYAMIDCTEPDSFTKPAVTWRTMLNMKHNTIFWDFMTNFFILDEGLKMLFIGVYMLSIRLF